MLGEFVLWNSQIINRLRKTADKNAVRAKENRKRMNKKSEKEQKTQNASLKQADSFSQGLRANVEEGVRGCDGCKAWALPSFHLLPKP